MQQTAIDQLINHISLVLDCSTSMQRHEKTVVEVAKNEIKNLAERSSDLNQETRISIYSFSEEVKCLVYDKDVLRLPEIDRLYKIGGNTALIDATLKSIEDLEKSPQLYGDHAFFEIVVTDGEENRSRRSVTDLRRKIDSLSDNWTLATLVPDQGAIRVAAQCGFNQANCGTWDTSSAAGFKAVGSTIRSATDTFFTNRAKGVRGSANIFTLDTRGINREAVTNSLERLSPSECSLHPVYGKIRADEFCQSTFGHFALGSVYYQLTKPEEIQPQKAVCVVQRSNGAIYGGDNARKLLGLPNTTIKVAPDYNPIYDIYVQSTAPNRNLMPNTKVLVMK